MFEIKWTNEAVLIFQELKQRAKSSFENRKLLNKKKSSKIEGLFKQVYKTITLLSNNPRHQSLNTHEFNSLPNPINPQEKTFEAYVQNNTLAAYRIFWCYGPNKNQITIIDITSHP